MRRTKSTFGGIGDLGIQRQKTRQEQINADVVQCIHSVNVTMAEMLKVIKQQEARIEELEKNSHAPIDLTEAIKHVLRRYFDVDMDNLKKGIEEEGY